ncbi:hypothetical protein BLS_004824 [Venturia inaequalis]|uniref:Protein kinase domain-containing protein n=1 Tax=Venturia inaequalis TaxID=5025 RepID=A0A8H3V6Z6_VENIN|nr:hypothetical protein BLS_004824 [Venturia inaequalis]
MPNNSYITPYHFHPEKCLSLGPSQGIVYRLSDKTVIKLPFQYPVKALKDLEEAEDQIEMSLRSMTLFEKEKKFYDLLAESPHSNLATRIPTNPQTHDSPTHGIILEYLHPLLRVWSEHSEETHFVWIQQLLSALERLEELGYTHGDLKADNLGIDKHHNLRLFDFGSIIHYREEGFKEQVVEDHFKLATCIHFLASGIDPFANVNSYAEVKQITNSLRRGEGVVHSAASFFEETIQAGWTGATASNFSQLRESVASIIGSSDFDQEYVRPEVAIAYYDVSALEKQLSWLDKQEYCAAWKAIGFEVPHENWV